MSIRADLLLLAFVLLMRRREGRTGRAVAIPLPSVAAEVEAGGGDVGRAVAILPPSVATGVDGATWVGCKVAPLALLLFLLWVTPTATPTITATTTSAPTIMIARPLVVRYHGVDFDLLTCFGQQPTVGFSSRGGELPEARGAKGKGGGEVEW